MAETLSTLPPFKAGYIEFRAHIVEHGGSQVYVWRSGCSRLAVGQRIARREVIEDGKVVERSVALGWARVDGDLIGNDFASLKRAMQAASDALDLASLKAGRAAA